MPNVYFAVDDFLRTILVKSGLSVQSVLDGRNWTAE